MSQRAKEKLYKNHLRKDMILSTVSGVASTKPELVGLFDSEIKAIDIITTKSFQVRPNPGNTGPVILSPRLGDFGNSVGLRNPGMEAAYPPLKEMAEKGFRALLNVSLSADNPEDFVTLIRKFDDIADMVELNFSCPHAAKGFGASIGADKDIVSHYVSYIHEHTKDRKSLLIIKLTPNVPNIGEIAKAAIDAGADGIAAINTVGPKPYYLEDGSEILHNALGGKGGASGAWVRERSIECVKEIRAAIGDEPIILGMGGVTTSEDARELIDAGADSVGIGSAIARVDVPEWQNYFRTIKEGGDVTKYLTAGHENLEYKKHTVVKKVMYDDLTVVLELDGKDEYCNAGQFAFLFIPGAGERPFSVAKNDPLSFIIKVRGEFTERVKELKEGDTIYTRGLCGAPIENPKSEKAVLLGGGTGVVVLNLLARKLHDEGTSLDIRLGVPHIAEGQKGLLQDELSEFGSYRVVADDGEPGRVIKSFSKEDVSGDTMCYVVGPSVMMKAAARHFMSLGVSADRIMISVETRTMCGIGMCGECVCGSRIPCKQGTFIDWKYIVENGVEL